MKKYTSGNDPCFILKRNVCNGTMDVKPEKIINKHFSIEDPSSIALDKIVQKLQCACNPLEVLLLITPSSKHQNHYKLNVIHRIKKTHLGMASITRKELSQLKVSKALEKYCIIISSKYINLKSVAMKSPIIENLVNAVNESCCFGKCNVFEPKCNCKVEKAPPNKYNSRLSNKLLTVDKEAPYDYELNSPHLMQLIERINAAIEPCATDLQTFFDVAEKYKFKIYIRPELCWKNSTDSAIELPYYLPRFNVECFMLFDSYVGGISIVSEHLEQQLGVHPNLLTNVQIISDVCDIIPMPRRFVACLRKLSQWIGMEILYDAFGEYVFDIYKQCKQCT